MVFKKIKINVDVKKDEWIKRRVHGVLYPMLGGGTAMVNGQCQTVESENYCYSSVSVAFIDEKKTAYERLP